MGLLKPNFPDAQLFLTTNRVNTYENIFFLIFLYVKLFCNPYDIKIYYYKKVKKLIKKFSEPFWTLE